MPIRKLCLSRFIFINFSPFFSVFELVNLVRFGVLVVIEH